MTGGTGFIGSHTVEQLLAEGFYVRCLIRPNQTNLKWLQGLPVNFVECNLLDRASIIKSIEDVEYIIHIAGVTKAKHKNEFNAGNVTITKNLLCAASQLKHLKKFCYISSLTAVGPSPTGIPLNETALCNPITTYGKSKLEAENLCKQYSEKLPIVIIRPPAVFGPRDTDILEIFKWVAHGIKPILGSSAKTVSVVYAPDLAKGIIRATFNDKTIGETYNIADPTIYNFSSIIEYLATLADKRTIKVILPNGLVYSIAGIMQFMSLLSNKPAVLNIEKARDLLQKYWVCDPRKIQEHIGFQTQTSMYAGVEKTFRWYKEKGWL